MHWTERGRAVVRIGEELRNRGWTLFGYTEDQSDMQTDYYSPASWMGVATHPELAGTVVCVDVSVSTVNFQSGDNGWPEFKATQHGKTWHVERDCETIYAGVGLAGCSGFSERWHGKVRQVCDHIERVAYGPPQTASESSTVAATGDYTFTVEHDRDWTWLFFDAKPSQAVRDQLKGMGARWGRKKQGWYFKRNVMDAELAWLTAGDDNDEVKGEDVAPLVLDDEGMDADPVTGYEPGRGDAFDYIPEWMTVPGIKETEGQGVPLALIKLFAPDSDWTWYVIEYDPQIKEAFGLVVRDDRTMTELGYFSLSEMETVTGPLGLRIERDLWFTPKPITEVEGYKTKWENGGPYQAEPKKETKPDRPEPKFDIGDFVLFEWETKSPERHEIIDREYREFEGNWHYKADWKWWGENGLVMAEAETELPEPVVQVSEKLPDGWKIEDIEFLLEKVKDGRRILVADSKLGIPTIHDFAGTTHCGMGVMRATLDGCTITFDAGASMDRTPSGRGFTDIQVTKGEYDYPFDEIRANLEAVLDNVKTDDEIDPSAEVKLKQCLDDRHEIWIGETWEDAIRQSVTTPDCGIEETETGYCLFGWSNGYEQKYTRPIPPVLNTYVEQLLQDQKEAQDMRDLLYDDEGNLRDIDEIDTEKADELLAPFMPGGVNGPDKVFSCPPEMPLNKLESGDQVWWEDKAGNVLTGVVDYVASDGNVVVKCNDHLAVAGGVPIGRIEHVKLNLLTRGEPPEILTESEALEILNETTEPGVNPAQTLTVDMLDAVARVQGAVIVPDDKSDAEEEDGIPDFIEVDLGRKYGWATAAVARMRGKWLYYHLTQEHCHKPDRRGGKVQVIGRDILWRSIAVPASQGAQ